MVLDQLGRRFHLIRQWEPGGETALEAAAPHIRGLASTVGGAPVDEALLDRLPKLEIIASFGVGYDHIDAAAAGRRGVVVTNTPDVLTEEVADAALGLLISTVRQLPQAERYLRAGKWHEANFPLSPSLRDRVVGIYGMGRIGRAIARRLDAFGVPVAYFSRTAHADMPYPYYPDLVSLARNVDTLIAIAPGTPETRNAINAEVLAALGPRGILINVARGSVVDEPALIEALKTRTILSAGLDVFADEPNVPAELIAMDHVVLLPHVGSAALYTREAMAQLTIDNLVSWFDGRGPLTPVPETPWRNSRDA
ncbi:glycerate dehydrogenase [Blastochloris tepida]|uniref:Glycerate dehydrogenase n=2 Tax=Blastochloris tepida TaxID=2233851 RepID=A0A348FWE8_9HYPH|nr:glycerate dehydrogenase [Blastochloris tepida]